LNRFLILKSVLLLSIFAAPPAFADELDDLMEQARERGKYYDRIRTIINTEPDQNVRLAAFDLMVQSEDPHVKSIAIEAGLASTDHLLQAAAFKLAIFDLEEIYMTLKSAESSGKKKPDYVLRFENDYANQWVIKVLNKDYQKGTFQGGNDYGEFNGLTLNYNNDYWKVRGILKLIDGDRIEGFLYVQGYKLLANGKIR